ncbi:MAG TPA: hypothetical protein VEQ58_06555, partial [Polyangiaceae bacterium]|nr:hypothetical protein [Polyangiaceae bacterium]
QVTETNVESRSFQCETRLCLVNHFQGRVSCPFGQNSQVDDKGVPLTGAAYDPQCAIPGTKPSKDATTGNNINVQVPAQLVARQTDKAVYCSCRCDGPDKKAKYCDCPEGFECAPLVDDLHITNGSGQLAGSYCIRTGSKYDPNESGETCSTNNPSKCCGTDKSPPACKGL